MQCERAVEGTNNRKMIHMNWTKNKTLSVVAKTASDLHIVKPFLAIDLWRSETVCGIEFSVLKSKAAGDALNIQWRYEEDNLRARIYFWIVPKTFLFVEYSTKEIVWIFRWFMHHIRLIWQII